MDPIFDEIRPTDLAGWADRVESDRLLHSVITQLVLGSGAKLRECRFLTHEGVNTSGWDGIVVADGPGLNVPAGPSGWELSKDKDVISKAQQDIADRSANPGGLTIASTAYVAVTLRRWPARNANGRRQSSAEYKIAWSADQQKKFGWQRVNVIDSADLAAWLASNPGAAISMSQVMGRRVNGARSLLVHWQQLATIQSGVNPSLFLAGREKLVSDLNQWITARPGPFEIRSWAPEDFTDAIAAWWELRIRDPKSPLRIIPVIVQTNDAWAQLVNSASPLLLVPEEGLDLRSEQMSAATAKGHYVLYRTEAASARISGAALPSLTRDLLAEELHKLRFDLTDSWRMATEAGGSGVVLKRILLGHGPDPEWAKGSDAPKIAPVVLIGSWDADVEGDRTRVEDIFRKPYAEVAELLGGWVKRNDPLMRRLGSTWGVINRQDAWRWLAPHLKGEDLARYHENAVSVLAEVDPRHNLPTDEQIFASIRGAVPNHSHRLRRSLGETLCLLALRPVDGAGAHAEESLARRTVQEVLARATNWKLWASFGESLLFIAEAAPDLYLAAVERDLAASCPAIAELFHPAGDALFAGIPQTYLMWALEGLLWHSRWASAAAEVLAKLAQLDPGGNTSPRPLGALREAFLPWLPQTCLDSDERCKVLDRITKAAPDVAWQLLMKLLPKTHDVTSPTHAPTYLGKSASNRKVITEEEYWKEVNHVANRLIELAGVSSDKWTELIRTIDKLPATIFNHAVEAISAAAADWNMDQKNVIWNALRAEAAQHRFFVNARWRMSDTTIAKIEKLAKEVEPPDAMDRTSWLFSGYSVHAVGATSEMQSEERRRRLEQQRVEALREIAASGIDAMRLFALKVNEPGIAGYLTAQHKVTLADAEILPKWLGSEEKLKIFARGYFSARLADQDWGWLDGLSPGSWDPEVWAELRQVVPFGSETWQRLEKWGKEFSERYWTYVDPSAHNVSSSDIETGLIEFLNRDRVAAALRLLESARFEKNVTIKIDIALRVLEAMVDGNDSVGEQIEPYQLSDVFSSVQDFPSLTNDQAARVERLEWRLFPVMESYITTKFLNQRILTEPGFFVTLLQMRPWSDDTPQGDRKLTPEQQRQFENSQDLLERIHELPGQSADGTLDYEAFLLWVERARDLAKRSGYASTCERRIGEMVVHSPADADGLWPTQNICEFLSNRCDDRARAAFRAALLDHQGWPPALVGNRITSDMSVRAEAVVTLRAIADRLTVEFPRIAELLRTVAEEEEHFINYRPVRDYD